MPRKAKEPAAEGRALVRTGLRGVPATVTEQGCAQIQADAARGLTNATIAARLGIHRSTLIEIRRRQPEVDEALGRGKGLLEDELTHVLLTAARNGEWVAALALGKVRLGWRDSGPFDGAQVNQVNVAVSMTTPELREQLEQLLARRAQLIGEAVPDDQ